MITKLTSEQESEIPHYIEKWVGMSSRPMDEKKAITYTKKLYASMNEKEPIVVIADSPLSACLMAAIYFSLFSNKKGSQLYSQLRSQLDSQLRSQLGSQLYSQLRSQLDSQLRSQLRSQLDSQLDSQLRSQLDSQLRSQLGSQLGSQLYSQLDSQLDSQLRSRLGSQLYSQLGNINNEWYLSIYWLIWCAWYEYGKYIGVKFTDEIYDLFVSFISEVNFIIPYKGIAFISRKPEYIKWKGMNLHSGNSPSVRYKDGYSMWNLNGVRMEEKHIMTQAEKINIQEVLKEENVEVRRELIRKIGIERFIIKSGAKVLDKQGDYELLSVKLSDEVPDARYLKMKNPSIGVWHVEGVEGDTVKEALNWRAGDINKDWKPRILT